MNIYSINQRLLAIIGNVFRAHAVLLFLPTQGNECNQLAAWWCPSRKFDIGFRVEAGKGYVGFVMRHETHLLVPHTDIHGGSLSYYGENVPSIQSFFALPLQNNGVLALDSLEQDAFNEEDHKLLQLFTQIFPQIQECGLKTINAAQINEFFKGIETLAHLRSSYSSWPDYIHAVLQIIGKATGFEYVSFASMPEEGNTYFVEAENVPLIMEGGKAVELQLQSGMVGWVLRNGEGIFNEGNTNAPQTPLYGKIKGVPDFPAAICIPIHVEKSTCACLCLASREIIVISSELRSFLRMATDDIAQLLEQINLKHKYKMLLKKINTAK